MERKNLVFVYGTLRNGYGNHHLLKEAHCYGIGCTDACYAMYLVHGFPYVTSTEARYRIVGELYAVDDDTLNILDSTEGHPIYYERREIPVTVCDEHYTAWMYFRDPKGVLMQGGDYNEVSAGKPQTAPAT